MPHSGAGRRARDSAFLGPANLPRLTGIYEFCPDCIAAWPQRLLECFVAWDFRDIQAVPPRRKPAHIIPAKYACGPTTLLVTHGSVALCGHAADWTPGIHVRLHPATTRGLYEVLVEHYRGQTISAMDLAALPEDELDLLLLQAMLAKSDSRNGG